MIVTIDDAIKAGLCASGFVKWAKARGIPRDRIRDMLANGVQLSELERIDDPYAQRMVEYVKQQGVNRG